MDIFKNYPLPKLIDCLILYANVHLCLPPEDNVYYRNLLGGVLGVEPGYTDANDDAGRTTDCVERLASPDAIVEPLIAACESTRKLEISDKALACFILGVLMPQPSRITEYFNTIISDGGDVADALDWFYDLCIKSNYIPMREVSENIKWRFDSAKGPIDVTINVSKPEKNNADVAKALKAGAEGSYPKCALCLDNCGFFGNAKTPPRQTLRTLPLVLNKEEWFFQYSPYNYFNEHCIAVSNVHRPMKTDINTFVRLLDFVALFPRYFMGSNADLPIVGGSIMTHDHYQGGRYDMPLFSAKPRMEFFGANGVVRLTVPDWGATTLRVESRSYYDVLAACDTVLKGWRAYCNPALNIINSPGEPHNAVTAIARRDGGNFVMEMILRNNHTTEERPGGFFHVDPKHHNIKKEGIGLIEAMGVFILPGRLANEARAIIPYLTGAAKFGAEAFKAENPSFSYHAEMVAELSTQGRAKNDAEAGARIEAYINTACEKILDDIGVFKQTPAGNIALIEFIVGMGFEVGK